MTFNMTTIKTKIADITEFLKKEKATSNIKQSLEHELQILRRARDADNVFDCVEFADNSSRRIQDQIDKLFLKAETGADYAELCRLEDCLVRSVELEMRVRAARAA